MNQLGVLSTNVKTYFMRRLIEEVGQSLVVYSPTESYQNDCQHILVRCAGVERDDRYLQFLRNLPDDVKIHNPLNVLLHFQSKNSQYEFFKTSQVPILPWIDLSSGIFQENSAELLEDNSLYLVKPRRGQGGWGIQVLNQEQLFSWWEHQNKIHDLDFILQPFIDHCLEFRTFFCGSETFSLIRSATTTVTANFAAGGVARPIVLDPVYQTIIDRVIEVSGASYGAIDFLVKDDKLWILELNSVPGIEQLEAITGLNFIRLILNEILS